MSNMVCEADVLYKASHKNWTSKREGKVSLEGGYAPFINEMIMIRFSYFSIHEKGRIDIEELNYKNYHFKNKDLKFNRDEINER